MVTEWIAPAARRSIGGAFWDAVACAMHVAKIKAADVTEMKTMLAPLAEKREPA
jgi:hypothetical protein